MRKNGFNLNMAFWKTRYNTLCSLSGFRKDYTTTIPMIMTLCNIREITSHSIPKILWRLSTFHSSVRDKLIKTKGCDLTKWLTMFVGYHAYSAQQMSNAAYTRKMTKR